MSPPSSAYSFGTDGVLIDPRLFVSPAQWVDKSTRSRCLVCVRDFNPMWRKKHTCRMCGDVVCSRCSVHKHVDLPLKDNLFRICTWCFLRVRQTPPTVAAVVAVKEIDDGLSEHSSFLDTDHTRATEDVDDDQSEDDGLTYDVAVVEDFVDPDLELLKMREQELEAQVNASRLKVQSLEDKIQEAEHQVNLTTQQQQELADARALIADLQRQLQEKEDAHYTTRMTLHEDTFHHRMTLSGVGPTSRRPSNAAAPPRPTAPPPPAHPPHPSIDSDDDAARLRRQLAKMARQMAQAGLNVADDIPYEEAKQRVAEISRRMQAIGSAEVVVQGNPQQQAALRKEYFQLEQDMEKYNTALMVSDEYMAEQAAVAKQWEDQHAAANAAALRQVRSCVPVNVSMLSEKQLADQLRSPDLARKLKRTNVLALCRVDPSTIQRMHPSLVEGYRVVGLSVLERRALHVVLAAPMAEWRKQSRDELAKRKLAWASKLRDALVAAVASYEAHLGNTTEALHACNQRHQCPVAAEAKARALYATDLGCPQGDVYHVRDVVQASGTTTSSSVASSAARDAIAEARTQQRLVHVKRHYKGNVLQVTQAMGAIEEMDGTLAALAAAEEALVLQHGKDKERLAALVLSARDAVSLMAKRSGICLVGKRDRTKDAVDGRSRVEASVAHALATYVDEMRDEMEVHMLCVDPVHKSVAWLQALAALLPDVAARNAARMEEGGDDDAPGCNTSFKRTSWKDIKAGLTLGVEPRPLRSLPASLPLSKAAANPPKPSPPLNFLEELKKAKAAKGATPANEMLAKIRARRTSKADNHSIDQGSGTTKSA